MPPLHLEVLTPQAKTLWPRLPEFGDDYYLAGGTALALQLNHRQSFDFDLFSKNPIPRNQLVKVEKIFTGDIVTPSTNNRDELTVLIRGVKCSFIHYPFPLLFPLLNEEGLQLLSAHEIAATKAYTIGRRGAWKDYIDLYACLTTGVTTLEQVIGDAQKKYADVFNDRLFLEQLVYLDDLDDTQGLREKTKHTPGELQAFFKKAIADLHLAK